MLQSVTGYLKKRQRGLAVLASFAGGAWLLTSYARQRFRDLSERMVLDTSAKENLRRRFRQNQEDCTFVLLAQLPTLSRQLLTELDVEALTAELQRRAEQTKRNKASTPLDASTASLDISQILGNGHVASNGEAIHDANHHATLEAATVPLPQDEGSSEKPKAEQSDYLQPDTPIDPRSKLELWHAIKLQTFHRTITTIYLICLLALQTHIQLNLLGRHNYVSSIYEQAFGSPNSDHDEEDDAMAANGHVANGSRLGTQISEPTPSSKLDPMTERQYLSFTWWFLERGWRSISGTVSSTVEELVGHISLKEQFGMQEFNKLIIEIRRKIEYEPTGAVHSFANALFPSTLDEERETLFESGLPANIADAGISPELRSLLNETQDFIDSPDFSIVLRSCLDKSFEIMTSSLGHLFVNMPATASSRFEEVEEKRVRLAAILPALARTSHSVLTESPNEYADSLASNRELQEFSAVVFSHFRID